MRKLVLVAVMFMFVCGGSFLAQAHNSVKASAAQTEVKDTTVVNDTIVKDTTSVEPVKE